MENDDGIEKNYAIRNKWEQDLKLKLWIIKSDNICKILTGKLRVNSTHFPIT